jgi:hypothetical protein
MMMLARLAAIGMLTAMPSAPALAQKEYGPNDTECRGRLLDSTRINDYRTNGPDFAELQLYYAPAEDLFCGRMLHVGPTRGVRSYTYVQLIKKQTREGPGSPGSDQGGQYEQVAGPVGSRAPCMYALGSIRYKGTLWTTTTKVACR